MSGSDNKPQWLTREEVGEALEEVVELLGVVGQVDLNRMSGTRRRR